MDSPIVPLLDLLEDRGTFRLPAEFGARALSPHAAVRSEGRMRFWTERGFRVLRGPLPGLAAEAEHSTDGRCYMLQHFLAVLRVVQRAGRRLDQRQYIEFDDIVDVHIGPEVLAFPDVQPDAG